MNVAHERMTTADDGEGTVNERLSTGGPGPEGQPDTAVESLSGQAEAPTAEPAATSEPDAEAEAEAETPKPRKRAAR